MATSTMSHPTAPKLNIPSVFAGKAWQQVLARDPKADGQFVYAVRSTRIFCKPSCPSRRPDRKNVAFFPSAAAAAAAGFRACLRCEPELAAPRPDPQADALATVTRYLAEYARRNGNARAKLADVARATGVPRLTILRGFKRVFGLTPAQFTRAQQLSNFRDELRPASAASQAGQAPITEAMYEAGFSSASRLYETSEDTLGMTPTELLRGAPGHRIRYTIADSPMGRTLVAATDRGICAIAFGDTDQELRLDLRARFCKADLQEEHDIAEGSAQASWLAEAVRFVLAQTSEHPTAATFPVDVRATAFQHRVWQALRLIQRGQTLSYGALARQIGQPTASRAVASACAANPLAIFHPCHRVVGGNGSLTGYRWGLERKRRLLEVEESQSRQSARI